MLLIVRYTGHDTSLPLNWDSVVLSDATITGATTTLGGSLSQYYWWGTYLIDSLAKLTYLSIPPPISSPHLIIHSIHPPLITVYLLRNIWDEILIHRISNQLLYTSDRILLPELKILTHHCPILPNFVYVCHYYLASPLCLHGKAVNLLQQCSVVVEGKIHFLRVLACKMVSFSNSSVLFCLTFFINHWAIPHLSLLANSTKLSFPSVCCCLQICSNFVWPVCKVVATSLGYS